MFVRIFNQASWVDSVPSTHMSVNWEEDFRLNTENSKPRRTVRDPAKEAVAVYGP